MKLLGCFVALLTVLPLSVGGTEQIPDYILIDGVSHSLQHSSPLYQLFSSREFMQSNQRQKIAPYSSGRRCSASWRGYQAFWELRDQTLILLKVFFDPCDKSPRLVPLEVLFPDQSAAVPATWFNGTLVFPLHKQGQVVHPSQEPEQHLLITFKAGRVVERWVMDRPRSP